MEQLYKKDAIIVLYEKEADEELFNIYITNKNEGGDFYGKWKDFQPELSELCIVETEDEWQYDGDRLELKLKLEQRGFNVILGENY